MNIRMLTLPVRIIAVLTLALALTCTINSPLALALDGVNARVNAPDTEQPANTWVPITVQVNNVNADSDITVHEAGFRALPDGLECRGDLKTVYDRHGKTIAKGTSAYTDVHTMQVRKSTSPTPAPTPTSDPAQKGTTATKSSSTSLPNTSDTVPLATLAFAALASGVVAAHAYRRKRIATCADSSSDANNADGPPRRWRNIALAAIGALLLTGAAAVAAMPGAMAQAAPETETAECTITVKIDGKEYNFDGYVNFSYDSPSPTPTPDPDPTPDPEPDPSPTPDPDPDPTPTPDPDPTPTPDPDPDPTPTPDPDPDPTPTPDPGPTPDPTPTPDPETTDIEVEKIWHDEIFFDDEGKPIGSYQRPNTVTIVLTDTRPEDPSTQITEVGKTVIAPDGDGNWSGTITVPKHDKEGTEIDYSNYYLVEKPVSAGFGYESSQPKKQQDGAYTATVWNYVNYCEKRTPLDFTLYKVNANTVDGSNISEAIKLEGAEFSLSNISYNPAKVTTLTTDSNGKATYTFTEQGTYVLAETSTPAPYAKDDGTLELVVEKSDLEDIAFDANKGMWVLTYGLTYSFGSPSEGTALAHLFPQDVPEAELGHSIAVLNDIQQEYLTLSVTKIWEDNNDANDIRPKTFTLAVRHEVHPGLNEHVGNVDIATAEGRSQTCSFDQTSDGTRFGRYKPDGSEWVYDIVEATQIDYVHSYKNADGSDSSLSVENGGTIINWLARNVTVAKQWNDAKYFEGEAASLGNANEYSRPREVELDLVGTSDGEQVWKELQVLTTSEAMPHNPSYWRTDAKAPTYSGSKEIGYEVVEEVPDGYVASISSTTVTNTPVDEDDIKPLTLTIKKVDQRTGNLLSGAVFAARPSGQEAPKIETAPTGDNGETTLTFEAAHFAYENWEIVEQMAPEGYVPSKTVYNVVLDKTLTSIKPVEKEDQGTTMKVWQWSYDSSFGQGTHSNIRGNAETGYTLTVANSPSRTFSFMVEKGWYGKAVADAVMQVKNGDQVVATQTFPKSTFDDTSYVVWNVPALLPAYDRYGELIKYTVHEVVPDSGEFVVQGNDAEVTYIEGGPQKVVTIINTQTVGIQVALHWEDDDFFDNEGDPLGDYKRPESVTVVLTDKAPNDSSGSANEIGKVVLTSANTDSDGNWTGTINVPKYDMRHNEIDYSEYFLVESPVSDGFNFEFGSLQKQQDGNWNGTGSIAPKIRMEGSTDFTVYAVDRGSVTVSEEGTLIANGAMLEGAAFTLTADGMSETEPILLTTGEDGKATTDRMTPGTYILWQSDTQTGYQTAVGSYKIIVSKDGFVSTTFDEQEKEWVCIYNLSFGFEPPDQGEVIDSRIPVDVPEAGRCIAVLNESETTSKTVTMTWVDGGNDLKTRPNSLNLLVKSDVGAYERDIELHGTGDTDTWSATLTGLPKYRGKNEIAYFIDYDPSKPGAPLAPAPEWMEGDPSQWDDFYRYSLHADGLAATNTLTMVANGQMSWEDLRDAVPDQADERIPAQVELVLKRLDADNPEDDESWKDVASTTVQTGQQTNPDQDKGYNVYTFGYVPIFNANGDLISYRAAAPDQPLGWTCVGNGPFDQFCTPATVTLILEKTWDDDDNAAQKRPVLYSELLDAVGLYVGDVPIEDTVYSDYSYYWMDSEKTQGNVWTACFEVRKYADDFKTELEWNIREVGTFEGYVNGQVTKGDDGVFRVTNTYKPTRFASATMKQ